jgi:hypothetical protein
MHLYAQANMLPILKAHNLRCLDFHANEESQSSTISDTIRSYPCQGASGITDPALMTLNCHHPEILWDQRSQVSHINTRLISETLIIRVIIVQPCLSEKNHLNIYQLVYTEFIPQV